MKKLIILLLLFSIPVLASELSGTPKQIIDSYLNPLKRGVKGLDEASKGLNGGGNDEARSELRSVMKDSGKLVSAKLKDSETTKLGGSLQKFVYELEFANGKKKEIYFKLLRTMDGGDFQIMGVTVE